MVNGQESNLETVEYINIADKCSALIYNLKNPFNLPFCKKLQKNRCSIFQLKIIYEDLKSLTDEMNLINKETFFYYK